MDPKELDALVDKIPAIRAYYAGTTLTTVEEDINCLCDAVAQLARREARLREALERTTDRLSLAFSSKPVRDVAETLADARQALAEDAANLPAPVEPAIPITDRATWRGHCGDGDWGDVVYADLARQLEAHARAMAAASQPFASGSWGKLKAWIVNGASTREDGIKAAAELTGHNAVLDKALADWREFCKEHERTDHDVVGSHLKELRP